LPLLEFPPLYYTLRRAALNVRDQGGHFEHLMWEDCSFTSWIEKCQ